MRRQILIVDNDPIFLTTAEQFFALKQFDVKTVASVDQAIQVVRENHRVLDLVIIDIRLEFENDPYDESGIQLAKFITTNYNLPVIVISINEKVEYVTKVLRKSNDDPIAASIVFKKEGLDCLLEEINRLLVFDLSKVTHLLRQSFDYNELMDLEFELNLDMEQFGNSKNVIIRELVKYCDRTQTMHKLVAVCARNRPHLPWWEK